MGAGVTAAIAESAAERAARPRVALVLDHPRRDMTGLILVALEMAQAGATALLVPQYQSWLDADFAEADAVVFNYARLRNIELIRWLAQRGREVFVLDTEGYLSGDRHKMLLGALRDLDVGPWLQGYLVWGAASGEAIARADPRLAPKVVVTGCPRFDVLAPRWRDVLTYERNGYILINTNFNSVNPLQHGVDGQRRSMLAGGWEPVYLERFLDDMLAAFQGFLDLSRTLAGRLPHRQFVVRPHPFEAAEPYRQALHGLPNVHVNAEGEVNPVLHNAARLVHLNCNTSVEARLLGKTPIQADFLNTDLLRTHLPLYCGVSVPAADLDELCRLLEDDAALAGTDDGSGIFERWIRPAFDACDGYASRRVAQAVLARIRPRAQRRQGLPAFRDATRRRLRRLRRRVAGGLLGTPLIERGRTALDPTRREKQFSLEQVQELVGLFSAHRGHAAPPVRRLRSPWTGMPMSAIRIG